jgi:hypothetical protein
MLCLAASLFRGWHNGGASADDEDDSKTSKVLFFISGGDAMVQISYCLENCEDLVSFCLRG